MTGARSAGIDGERVRKRLKALGMKISELAELCDMDRGRMSKIINEHTAPAAGVAGDIALALGLNANEVLGLPREHGLGVDS